MTAPLERFELAAEFAGLRNLGPNTWDTEQRKRAEEIDRAMVTLHPDRSERGVWPFPNDGVLASAPSGAVVWNRTNPCSLDGATFDNLRWIDAVSMSRFSMTSAPALPPGISPADLLVGLFADSAAADPVAARSEMHAADVDLAVFEMHLTAADAETLTRSVCSLAAAPSRLTWLSIRPDDEWIAPFLSTVRGEIFRQSLRGPWHSGSPLHVIESYAGRLAILAVTKDDVATDEAAGDVPGALELRRRLLVALGPTHVVVLTDQSSFTNVTGWVKGTSPTWRTVVVDTSGDRRSASHDPFRHDRDMSENGGARISIPQWRGFARSLQRSEMGPGDVVVFARPESFRTVDMTTCMVELIAGVEQCHFTHAGIVSDVDAAGNVSFIHRSRSLVETTLAEYGAAQSETVHLLKAPLLVLRSDHGGAALRKASTRLNPTKRYPIDEQALMAVHRYARRAGVTGDADRALGKHLVDNFPRDDFTCSSLIAWAFETAGSPLDEPDPDIPRVDIDDLFGRFWMRFVDQPEGRLQTSAAINWLRRRFKSGESPWTSRPEAMTPTAIRAWTSKTTACMSPEDFYEAISSTPSEDWSGEFSDLSPGPARTPVRLWGVADLINTPSLEPVGHLHHWWT